MGLLGGLGFSNSSKSTTANYDQRQVAEGQAIVAGAGASISVNTVDDKVQQFIAEMLSEVSGQQNDTVQAMARVHGDVTKATAEYSSDLMGKTVSNSATAWGHTLDKAGDLFGQLMQGASNQTDAARALSAQAISAAAPQQGANETLVKLAMWGAGAFALWAIFRGGKKG